MPLLVPAARRHRHRPLIWITAAAVAIGLTTSGIAITNTASRHTSDVPIVKPSVAASPDLSLPFALDKASPLQIVGVSLLGGMSHTVDGVSQPIDGMRSVDLASNSYLLNLTLTSSQSGVRPILSGSILSEMFNAPPYVEPSAGSAAPTSSAGPGTRALMYSGASRYTSQLAWEYGSGNWALLRTERIAMSEADLLGLARGMDFTASTPIRLPISLSQAPAGMHMDGFVSTYEQVGDAAPFDLTGSSWNGTVQFREWDTSGYTVRGLRFQIHPSGGGASAHRWDANAHALNVNFGNGIAVRIFESTYGSPRMTEQGALAIAKTISVASDPADRSTWFDVAKALPTGSR